MEKLAKVNKIIKLIWTVSFSLVQFISRYRLYGLQENVAIELIWKLEYYGPVIPINMFKIITGDELESVKVNK